MKANGKSFLRYALSSTVCFLLDYGLFTLLNAVILAGVADGPRELCATYGARLVSAVVNFLLNRNLVFKDASDPKRAAVRYTVLALIQAAVSAGLVALIRRLTGVSPLMETTIKIPVDMALFVLSYHIQKVWVFAGEKKDHD